MVNLLRFPKNLVTLLDTENLPGSRVGRAATAGRRQGLGAPGGALLSGWFGWPAGQQAAPW